MSTRVALLTEIMSPYRIPLFNALSAAPELDIHVCFYAETERRRTWAIPKDKIKFSYEVMKGWRFQRPEMPPWYFHPGVMGVLNRAKPQVVIIGGWNHPTTLPVLWWCARNNIPLIFWCESNDLPGPGRGRWYKSWIISRCQGFLAAGRAAKRLLTGLGANENKITIAHNAVEPDIFQGQPHPMRGKVPKILIAGRLAEEKGVYHFCAWAYATGIPCQFVVIGSGGEYELIKQTFGNDPNFTLKKEVTREALVRWYQTCDGFAFPTWLDAWGLVLNEAALCGKPLFASRLAGATEDLVKEGENGYTFHPFDEPGFAPQWRKYLELIRSRCLQAGKASQEIVSKVSLEQCARGNGAGGG